MTLRFGRAVSLISSVAMVLLGVGAAVGQSAPSTDSIVNKMTLEQKIDYIGGTGFAIRAMPDLGLPALEMSDGPVGVRSNLGFPSTTYAARHRPGGHLEPGAGGARGRRHRHRCPFARRSLHARPGRQHLRRSA